MRIVVVAVLMAALAVPSVSGAQTVIENFDQLPEHTIAYGSPLALEHFRVEIPSPGRDASIRPANAHDELASGMVMGIPDGQSLSTVFFYFKQPWRRMDITFVMPPSDEPVHSVAMLYGETEHPHGMTVQHSRAGHRVRVSMSPSTAPSFTSLVLHLQRGAYVDNVELR